MRLDYYETCNSQYHAGHHLPVVQVMVDGDTKYSDVQEMLKDSFAYGHLEDQVFRSESYYDEYNQAVDEWFNNRLVSLSNLWDSGLGKPEDEDEEWDCYAYFIIDEIDEHLIERLRKNPSICPFCDSENVSASIQDGNVDLSVTCMDCDEDWVEHYELEGATFNER